MIGIIIQARTGSTRLPNKMLLPFYDNKGLLEILVTNLINSDLNIPIVLATTNLSTDDKLADIAKRNKTLVYRGSENDVLDRFLQASIKYDINKIVRICADNPFLDMFFLKNLIEKFSENDCDYWCYALSDYTPSIMTHYGFWAEGVTRESLIKINKYTKEKFYKEHVTNYIYNNKNLFNIYYELIDSFIEKQKDIRLTIDTIQDFNIAKIIFNKLYDNKNTIKLFDVVNYIMKTGIYQQLMIQEILQNKK